MPTVTYEFWRSWVIEGRTASLNTQCTALLAVTAVILGIGATGLGSLGGRNLNGTTTVLAIVFAVVAIILLLGAAVILLSTIRVNPPTRTTNPATLGLLLDPDPAVALGGYESELNELSAAAENDVKVLISRTGRAAWLLGLGITAAVVLAAILIIVPTQPTKTQLVRGSQVSVQSRSATGR